MKDGLKITTIGYWGAYPGVDAATSSFLLEHKETRVLIDCGSGVLQNLQNYLRPEDLSAVFISHYHADHTADIGCLQYALRVAHSLGSGHTGPLPIYGHREDEFCHSLTYREDTVFRPYSEETDISVGSMSFRFFRTHHTEASYAFRVSCRGSVAAFSGDTAFCPGLLHAASGAAVFYCESSLYNAFAGAVEGHLTAGEAGRAATEAGVKQLVLTHLPHFGNHRDLLTEARETFSGTVTLNRPGLLRVLDAV